MLFLRIFVPHAFFVNLFQKGRECSLHILSVICYSLILTSIIPYSFDTLLSSMHLIGLVVFLVASAGIMLRACD